MAKLKAWVLFLVVHGIAARGIDDIDPCIRNCYFEVISKTFGCTGSPNRVASCGCEGVERHFFNSPLTECTEKNCGVGLDNLPKALTSESSCKESFAEDRSSISSSPTVAITPQPTLTSSTSSSSSTSNIPLRFDPACDEFPTVF